MAELSTAATATAAAMTPEREIVIEPSRGAFAWRWREFWEYRDLLFLLVERDFISRYKQTILGPLWFILQPLITTLVFTIFFARVAGIPTDGVPAPLFYLCGLLGWNYFAQNMTTGGSTFVTNAHLFGKVWFPRLIVPVSAVISNLAAFAMQLIPFVVLFVYFELAPGNGSHVQLTPAALLTPLPLLQIALLSLGVSLWMSASTAKYRDLVHLNQFIVQLWMFASPVIYPLSQVKAKWPWLAYINPMSAPIEAFRICLLGRGSLTMSEIIVSWALTIIILFTGIALFQKVERTVVDSV